MESTTSPGTSSLPLTLPTMVRKSPLPHLHPFIYSSNFYKACIVFDIEIAADTFSEMMLLQAIAANSHAFIGHSLSSRSSNALSLADPSSNVMESTEGEVELSLPKFKPREADTILEQHQHKYAPNQAKHIDVSTKGEPSSLPSTNTYPSHQL
jgi:hypothetical protein